MTSIIGFADLLTTEHPEEREKIETIRRNGQYLLSLINDILDLSKIEAGKLSLDTLRFSPQTLLEEVMKLMRVRAAEGGLEIALEFQSSLPDLISSDPIRIRQILINLVGNAIKFTESGSVKVLVSFSEEASELSIRVVDTGIGLSSEDLQRLFHPFSQADATISRRFGGSGLGLAISQRLASLLGGRITVESEQGKGSCFTLILPVKGDFELRPAVPHLAPITAQMTSSVSVGQLDIRVLVVDDRRDVRFLVQVFVNKLGGKTVLCENGKKRSHAFDQIRAKDWNLISCSWICRCRSWMVSPQCVNCDPRDTTVPLLR